MTPINALIDIKERHIHIIDEFYKAGYITFIEKEELTQYINTSMSFIFVSVSTKADGRDICYVTSNTCLEVYSKSSEDICGIDFIVKYNKQSGEFTVRDLTS